MKIKHLIEEMKLQDQNADAFILYADDGQRFTAAEIVHAEFKSPGVVDCVLVKINLTEEH